MQKRYEVYLDCSVTGELSFPYEVEADNAENAAGEVQELADSECLAGGTHTVVRVLPSGPEDEDD